VLHHSPTPTHAVFLGGRCSSRHMALRRLASFTRVAARAAGPHRKVRAMERAHHCSALDEGGCSLFSHVALEVTLGKVRLEQKGSQGFPPRSLGHLCVTGMHCAGVCWAGQLATPNRHQGVSAAALRIHETHRETYPSRSPWVPPRGMYGWDGRIKATLSLSQPRDVARLKLPSPPISSLD
jgi:hypothetical protein